MSRDITILGFACDQNAHTVFDGCFGLSEIWTFNDWWNFYPRLLHPDRVFQVHENYEKITHVGQRDVSDWKLRYNKSGAKIFSISPFDGIENTVLIDLEKLHSVFRESLFTSSVSCALMHAIIEKVDSISLEGVSFSVEGEYDKQRPAVALLCSMARAEGIAVNAPCVEGWLAKWEDVENASICYWGKKHDCKL